MKTSISAFLISTLIAAPPTKFGFAQVIGMDLCSCAPSTYEFTFDFSLTCPPVNVTTGDAVAETACMISPFGDPTIADLVPVAVSEVQVLELDQNLDIVGQSIFTVGPYFNGDSITYTSIILSDAISDPDKIPKGISLLITGANANGDQFINTFGIIFTNDCGAYPVLSEGQSAGWVRFTDLGTPREEFCPIAAGLTAPTMAPASAPTTAPTKGPASAPTTAPTKGPASAPTTAPTMAPTGSPLASPSDTPTVVPSDVPSDVPSNMPSSCNERSPEDAAPPCNEYPPKETEAQTEIWNNCMMMFPDMYDDYCIQGDNTEELMMKVACFLSATEHSTDYRKRKKGQEIKICSGQDPITFPFVIGDSTFTGFRITNDVKITCKTSYDSDGEETCELARGGTGALSFCPVLSIECLDNNSKLYIKDFILQTGSNVIGHGNCIDGTRRLQSSNAPQDVKIKSSSKVSGKGKGKGSSSRSSRRSRRRVRGGKDEEPRRRALFEDANATNASLPFCMDPFFDDENVFEILEDSVNGDAIAPAATEETVPTSHLCKIARLSFNQVDPLTNSMDLMAAVTSSIPKGAFMVHHKTIWSTILDAFDANGDGEVYFDETVTLCEQ